MKNLFIVFVVASIVALTGCAKPPKAELEAASAVVDSVKSLPQVAEFAAAEMAAVDSVMNVVAEKIEAKDYEGAKVELEAVVPMAKAVADSANARKAFAQASGMVTP